MSWGVFVGCVSLAHWKYIPGHISLLAGDGQQGSGPTFLALFGFCQPPSLPPLLVQQMFPEHLLMCQVPFWG